MIALDINQLTCRYGETEVLSNLNLQIKDGEIVCLLGRSGCGKTTLLKSVSGLLQPGEGNISLHGRVVSSAKGMLPPEQRGIGMIFQDYALFPHLTVFDNIAFGLKGFSRQETQARVIEMLELVNLNGLDKRYPHELSGGQQQRVAIARALANKPSLLLLDEPFSNIDSQVRQRLVREIRDILKKQKVAALFVTHSREEGFAFADTVAVMHDGKIMQRGKSLDIYTKPANRFVADFMGSGNIMSCEVLDENKVLTPLGVAESVVEIKVHPGQKAELFVRPQMLSIKPTTSKSIARVKQQQFMGRGLRTEVVVSDEVFVVENETAIPEQTPVDMTITPHELVLFDGSGESLNN